MPSPGAAGQRADAGSGPGPSGARPLPSAGSPPGRRRCVVGASQGLRWGLIGASDIAATSLVPGIRAQPASRVVAVHSRSAERGAAYARQHGIDRSHSTLAELLADPEVDAVYVSTANDRHAEEAIAAARAGRHVLCEKPLALSVADASAMVEAAARAGVVLATNHGRRNDPALRRARDLVRAGAMGTPRAARSATTVLLPERLRRWRLDVASGGGVALDLLVHDADTLRFVLDDDVVEVQADSDTAGPDAPGIGDGSAGAPAEQLVAGVLTTARGLLASFLCSFATPHGGSSLEVFGDQASLRADRMPGHPATLVLRIEEGEERVALPDAPPIGVATVAAFEAAVRGAGAPTATGQDGVASLAVALAARESARSGTRRTVEVPRVGR